MIMKQVNHFLCILKLRTFNIKLNLLNVPLQHHTNPIMGTFFISKTKKTLGAITSTCQVKVSAHKVPWYFSFELRATTIRLDPVLEWLKFTVSSHVKANSELYKITIMDLSSDM
jgi:hypothetical protein